MAKKNNKKRSNHTSKQNRKVKKHTNKSTTRNASNSPTKQRSLWLRFKAMLLSAISRINNWKKNVLVGIVLMCAGFLVQNFIIPIMLGYIENIEHIKSSIEEIDNNYHAGNFYEVEQQIYSIYSDLEKNKMYDALVVETDRLLEAIYHRFYATGEPLTDLEKSLVNSYIEKGKRYSDLTNDMPSYLEFCVHDAQFCLSEYECTLEPYYLEEMYNALYDAGDHFDWDDYSVVKVENINDVRLAIDIFNLKNLASLMMLHQAECYVSNSDLTFESYDFDSGESAEWVSELFSEWASRTWQFVAYTSILEAECEGSDFISSETLNHMKLVSTLAYMNLGNTISLITDVPQIYFEGGNEFLVEGYLDYEDLNMCYHQFKALESVAIKNKDYYDLVNVYASAERYFFHKYINDGEDQALAYYNHFIDKWLKFDPSGFNIPPNYALIGNFELVDHMIMQTLEKVTNMNFPDNPFFYALVHYRLGELYLMRAKIYEGSDLWEFALDDYKNSLDCFETALLYFSEDHEYIHYSINHTMEHISYQISPKG